MKKRQQSQMQISIEAKAKKGGQPWELVGVLITHTGTQCFQKVLRHAKYSVFNSSKKILISRTLKNLKLL